jgi:hypothetical protein
MVVSAFMRTWNIMVETSQVGLTKEGLVPSQYVALKILDHYTLEFLT